MKKIILPALAMLLLGGITNAQTTQKQPAKTASSVVSRPVTSNKTMIKTAAVTPAKTTKPVANKTAAIKRKHHHKPRKTKKQ
jgi:hypothetical protein